MAVETWGDERETLINERDILLVELAISETRRQKAEARRALMLAALESVEWVRMEGIGYLCPWCLSEDYLVHFDNCERQSAIGAVKGEDNETQ